MGSGKGDVSEYVCVVRPGRVLFEMAGVDAALAAHAMRLAGVKLPIKSKFIAREKTV
jgi:large subunit ribosomal protein L16